MPSCGVPDPAVPAPERCEELLDVLAEYVALGGPARLLAPSVVPGKAAFPEPWARTAQGLTTVLRRLAWHAGESRAIAVADEQLGAPPTQRKPETHVELVAVRPGELALTSWFVGEDDVAGTLAHELGVAHAVIARAGGRAPYRAPEPPQLDVDPDHDLERGSIATVYLGLGVLAANAAYQQYSSAGRFNGAYSPLEYDVLRAGYIPMSELAYLLAVQAAVRGDAAPPVGLSPPQHDEVAAWLAALDGRGPALRARLGIDPAAQGEARTAPVPFDDGGESESAGESAGAGADVDAAAAVDDAEDADGGAGRGRIAFRWKTHRAGEGFLVGLVVAFGAAAALPEAALLVALLCVAGGAAGGRMLELFRCSTCATSIARGAAVCRHCGAALHGDIARRADRLEAEERLLGAGADGEAPDHEAPDHEAQDHEAQEGEAPDPHDSAPPAPSAPPRPPATS